jgi:hypothetical protein
MDIQESVATLKSQYGDRAWFSNVTTDQYNRIVVLVTSLTSDVVTSIPDRVDGRQVLVHFDSAYMVKKESFVTTVTTSAFAIAPTDPAPPPVVIDEEDDNTPIEVLIKELDKLERSCGSNVLQDIFYEIHDGKNAVTNLSIKYPDVRKSLEELYEVFGFDVIYEELDG